MQVCKIENMEKSFESWHLRSTDGKCKPAWKKKVSPASYLFSVSGIALRHRLLCHGRRLGIVSRIMCVSQFRWMFVIPGVVYRLAIDEIHLTGAVARHSISRRKGGVIVDLDKPHSTSSTRINKHRFICMTVIDGWALGRKVFSLANRRPFTVVCIFVPDGRSGTGTVTQDALVLFVVTCVAALTSGTRRRAVNI